MFLWHLKPCIVQKPQINPVIFTVQGTGILAMTLLNYTFRAGEKSLLKLDTLLSALQDSIICTSLL
jgi:hypothetical protein